MDTQLPADVRSAFTRFMLLDRRNNLALADSCLFHCTVLSYEFSRFRQSEFSGGLHIKYRSGGGLNFTLLCFPGFEIFRDILINNIIQIELDDLLKECETQNQDED